MTGKERRAWVFRICLGWKERREGMEDFLRFSFLVLSFEASLQRNDCVFILSVEKETLEHIASDTC